MEAGAPTTQKAHGHVYPRSSTPCTAVVRSMDRHIVKFRVHRILNSCTWLSPAQQLKIQEQCIKKELTQVDRIFGEVWEALCPAEQQKHENEINRMKSLHANEFPVYKNRPKKKSTGCFFTKKQGFSFKSAQAEHHSTRKPKTSPKDKLNQLQPPSSVVSPTKSLPSSS